MSLKGARGLVQISRNPPCEVQAAMVADNVKELEFYESVTSEAYPGEFGERLSARRRGAKFESNLTQNYAALLRKAVGPLFGLDPDAIIVRNFDDELPGESNSARVIRMKQVFRDLKAGKAVPDLLIQPRLRLPIGTSPSDFFYIKPDFMVFDPKSQMYVPGEEKSFIVRDGVGDPGDLDPTRRQAGVQILALRNEASLIGLSDMVSNQAVFVFSTPFGLAPHDPFVESLDAAVQEITRAIQILYKTKSKLNELRKMIDTPLAMLLDELSFNFQENCVGHCILAGFCKKSCADSVRLLGNDAAFLLGPEAKISRIAELLNGAEPETPHEAVIAKDLIEAAKKFDLLGRTA